MRLRTISQIATFLIVLSLGVPIPSEATVLLTDSFEYGSQGAFEAVWPTSCPGASTIMGPSTEYVVSPMSPNRSLRSFQNGGVSSCYISRTYQQTTHVFYRWYMHLSAGYDAETVCPQNSSCPGGNGSKQMYAKSTGGYQVYFFLKPWSHTIRFGAPHSFYSRMCPSGQPDTECVYEPNIATVPIVPGNPTPYCIETELSRGSPGGFDGVGRVWINGILTLEYTNIAFARSDEGSTGFHDITHYSQGGYGTRHIDDLVVADARIGCSKSPAADVTSPAVPTGLAVR